MQTIPRTTRSVYSFKLMYKGAEFELPGLTPFQLKVLQTIRDYPTLSRQHQATLIGIGPQSLYNVLSLVNRDWAAVVEPTVLQRSPADRLGLTLQILEHFEVWELGNAG